MPSNTVYDPDSTGDFSKKGFNFNGQGIMATITPGTAQNIDLKLTDDHDFTGVQYLIWGGSKGDFVNLQVVDADGSLTNTQVPGYPTGVTYSMVPGYPGFGQYATNWYVNTDGAGTPINIPYPAKVLAGMTIRIIYNSVGTTAVTIAINFNIHKMRF